MRYRGDGRETDVASSAALIVCLLARGFFSSASLTGDVREVKRLK
jgi:hypothetical protein